MQFYKICGELIASEANEGERRTRKEIAHKIAAKTAEFNGANNTRYCFLSDLEEEYVTMGIIATQSMDLVAFVESYVKHIGLNAKVELPDEVTFGNLQNLLSNADRQSYIEDDNAILERFGLDRISGRRGRGLEFGENLINYAAKEDELFASAKRLFTNETLVPELPGYQGCARIPPMIISSIYYPWQLITFLELLLITLDLHTDLEYNNVAKIYGFRMALNRFDTQHGGKKTRCQTKQKTK